MSEERTVESVLKQIEAMQEKLEAARDEMFGNKDSREFVWFSDVRGMSRKQPHGRYRIEWCPDCGTGLRWEDAHEPNHCPQCGHKWDRPFDLEAYERESTILGPADAGKVALTDGDECHS